MNPTTRLKSKVFGNLRIAAGALLAVEQVLQTPEFENALTDLELGYDQNEVVSEIGLMVEYLNEIMEMELYVDE